VKGFVGGSCHHFGIYFFFASNNSKYKRKKKKRNENENQCHTSYNLFLRVTLLNYFGNEHVNAREDGFSINFGYSSSTRLILELATMTYDLI
jgi:hypothetical protein